MAIHQEKTSNVMGFVVSVLLHAIFFAGCLAIDATSISSPVSSEDSTEIKPMDNQSDHLTDYKS